MTLHLAPLLLATLVLAGQAPEGGRGKPLPQGANWSALVPPTVGAWHRVSLKEPRPGFDGEARYEGGGQSFFLLFGKAKDASDLKGILTTVEQESREPAKDLVEPEKVVLTGPSLQVYRHAKRGPFYAWTRGLYYFSVETKEGAPVLRAFVKAFPY
ncbi:MAG TPA: hypothetical protein VJ600_03205 [Holophagaceae bacterium]|nr:hypothetical protein [Holophagaceae bacterium]